ncbi:MFS family permease [Luteibacter sp. Sphag1AF]|uniref:hypothetical protein n=1 Tax=Luteibacter sp. Sphag1AF TaxID=2587031 RepID=UPI00161F41C2|nr:hypothetical protein [Luteibacter sp. Sphag1AF]MBB3228687.1 MFS family permease [Luteibacter sp. Sphag1AF]
MQNSETRAATLPYTAALAIIVVNLIFTCLAVYRILHMQSPSLDDEGRYHVLVTLAGSEVVSMVLSVALAIGTTQWFVERRGMMSPPGYAAALIGLGYAILGAVLPLAWWAASHSFVQQMASSSISLLVTVNFVVGLALKAIGVILPVWLVFHLLRKHERPTQPPYSMRLRALLIFTLLVWAWVLSVAQFAVPAAMAMAPYYGYNFDSAPLIACVGSFGFVLPAFIGALLGLPRQPQHTRPLRLLLASVVVFLVSVLVLVGLTYALLRIAVAVNAGFEPTTGFVAFIWLIWFVLSVALSGLLVRGLTRERTVAADAVA